jgi:head-tail adaptor
MRAGLLDQRIALQRKTTSYSPTGEPAESWTTLTTRWSSVNPVLGDERNASQQWIAREQTKFVIRWTLDMDNLSPLDRIVYPATDASNSPATPRSVFNIISVHEQGRRESLAILAARMV